MTASETPLETHDISHHQAVVNGITYHYAEAGRGPLVMLLHGFPELWYSWRHQLPALASAGYRAVAPDLRGFGGSQVTPDVTDYSILNHARDVMALIDHLGARQAIIGGHDWGANLMWIMPLLYPERVAAVISLSIPFYPEPRDPAEIRKKWPHVFTNFEKPGATEAEFEADPARFLRRFFYGLSGDAPPALVDRLYLTRATSDQVLDEVPEPERLPSWLSQRDLDYYVAAYRKTGLTPALGFYRNGDRDYPRLAEIYRQGIRQPALFVGGGREAAVRFGSLAPMQKALPNLRDAIVIPDCGHWVQQERPQQVNQAIIRFLGGLTLARG